MNWYYAIEGHAHGPITEQALSALAHDRKVCTDTLLWRPDLEEWEPVWKLKPEIIGLLNKSAMARQAKGATARIPLTVQAPIHVSSPGIFRRLAGLFKRQT